MRVALQLVAALLLIPAGASATLIGEDAELSYFYPDLATQFTGPGYAPRSSLSGRGRKSGSSETRRIRTCRWTSPRTNSRLTASLAVADSRS